MREPPRASERIDKGVTVAVKRHIIDTNYLGHDDLAAFLGHSTDNHAVIAEMTLVEVHKKPAAFQARQLLKILCQHPRQVIILRSTLDLYRDDSKGLVNRLIEPKQTGSFGEYCRTVIDVPDDEHVDAHFALMEDPTRPIARCRLCKGPIFNRAHFAGGEHAPVFAHYPESPADCPWYQGVNLKPDDARAAQYQGQQESALHRWLCETIAEVIGKDPRCQLVTVETYRRPAIATRGRFPDVYVELDRLGKFAIEVQLSKPFAPEIIARHLHYEAEGVALLWVFRELAAELPQGFHDVITLQRGNAFLFDDAALAGLIAQGKLVLTALLETDRGGLLKPRLVSLDDLDRSTGRAVFIEDRRSDRLLEYCRLGREKWWEAFREAPPSDFDFPFSEPCFHRAWDSIKGFVPALSPWKRECWSTQFMRGDQHFAELAAILFSIARTAATGKDRVYVTRYNGDGALVAMLNAKLSSQFFAPYASLIETMLRAGPARDRLDRASLKSAFAKAATTAEQITSGHPVWAGAARLFPEIFDGLRRAELDDLGRLPGWAGGAEQLA